MLRTSILIAGLLMAPVLSANVVRDVRTALSRGDFESARRAVAEFRQANGSTPETAEALSWLGRGAVDAERYGEALDFAAETREMVEKLLASGSELATNRRLRTALGASIEVEARAKAAQGALSEAVSFLESERERWPVDALRIRIQKNIHLLSLDGKPAPALELSEHIGPAPASLASLQGKVLLLFFWAHWCPDCKHEAPALARLHREYVDKGLVIMGPTRRYGFAARGEDVSPDEELRYLDRIRQEQYGEIRGMTVPVSERNFVNYGSSTTPTLVLVDREGIVRLYHPGQMSYEELEPLVAALF